jgi:hypothetical protein
MSDLAINPYVIKLSPLVPLRDVTRDGLARDVLMKFLSYMILAAEKGCDENQKRTLTVTYHTSGDDRPLDHAGLAGQAVALADALLAELAKERA